ncbi:MAG TPA: iron hydrogenase small subunit [Rectinema sp.]|nr:iron hydrogenase small subunit [Rectinema sp.]HOM92683.1 iron hydrogenase small subunit [Rectinema sp.]HOR91857.1 iron hydrogenase small subunit [Rectinema sp.]HPK79592.1 iron hydrogenase small subunit [Rectinema sp.]HQE68701.1 iron hydrogenase small subunit [Rectinema sp.]
MRGSQPLPNTLAKRKIRQESLYEEDRNLPLRKSHENHEIKGIYTAFLGKPGSEVAYKLLHTRYIDRSSSASPPKRARSPKRVGFFESPLSKKA